MDSMPYIFAGLVGLASLSVSLLLAMRRLKTSEERIANAVSRKQAQVERIKKAARATLRQARDLRDARRRKAMAEMACEDLEQRLKSAGATDRRIYVLDDRRTQKDQGWLLRVVNIEYGARVNANLTPTALDSWKRGRRFLVWALDEKKAREKVHSRLPENKGFTVMGVESYLG
ncbi:hypothetical protein [Azospirillum lipoferum]|uniref:Uncharacterized protein n=1 Tax=Azospirillum lipoferum (strain 4B) TaxID=862719 RepID=G7Z2S3_AZOL4|nr:hypothetical protein [Azospirillum lipoferum]CBS85670.1 protein of unknown function; putative coiled-coil domain [Azospirillum lipoferum 4B]